MFLSTFPNPLQNRESYCDYDVQKQPHHDLVRNQSFYKEFKGLIFTEVFLSSRLLTVTGLLSKISQSLILQLTGCIIDKIFFPPSKFLFENTVFFNCFMFYSCIIFPNHLFNSFSSECTFAVLYDTDFQREIPERSLSYP